MTTTDRIDTLEREVADLRGRLARLEAPPAPERITVAPPCPGPRAVTGRSATPAPGPVAATTAATAGTATIATAGSVARPGPAASRTPAAPLAPTLEQLLGGRVLAWAGGAAILAGLAFLFALGVSSGWLDETRRCVLGALFAAGLVAGGVLLQRRGRTTAALAAVGAGVAGLYLADVAATSSYGLLPPLLGAGLAMAVGALGVRLALRWDASAVAGLGLLGAVCGPLLAGTLGTPVGLVLLAVATASGTAITLQRRWPWMGVGLALTATPQWIGAVAFADPAYGLAATLVVLAVFGTLGVAAAIGYELRVPAPELGGASVSLLLGSSAVLALAGYGLVDDAAGDAAATAWLAGLAAAHLAGVRALRRADRLSRDLPGVALVAGALLAEVAFALALDGPVRAAGWTLLLVGFAAVARRTLATDDHAAARAGVAVHAALGAAGAAAEVGAALDAGALTFTAGALVGGLALAAFAAARLTFEEPAREALDGLALAAAGALALLTLSGVVLTVALAAGAVLLAFVAQRTDDRVAAGGALMTLGAAAGWCIVDQAMPSGLATPLSPLGPAVLSLAAVAAAAALAADRARASLSYSRHAEVLAGAAALGVLHLASLVVVAVQPFTGDDMQGQLQLTALWAATGTAGLIAGLRRDRADCRTAALVLLAVTAGKLFLVDLQTLAAAWRVAACIAVGLLLLLAAYAHARLRPEPLPDLRRADTAFR